MFQITSFFLNYWNDWSADQGKALHERDLEPKIHIHELSVVFFSAGLPAFFEEVPATASVIETAAVTIL